MKKRFFVLLVALCALDSRADNKPDVWPAAIRSEVLNEDKPLYLQLNPRVTTTIRFPVPLEQDPVGTGFWVERENNNQPPPSSVEYILAWDQNDTRLDIQARANASLRNLNVTLGGKTFVIVCYPAVRPLDASAVVNLKFAESVVKTVAGAKASTTEAEATVRRVEEAPPSPYEDPTPARLVGMLDRLHIIHEASPANLDALIKTMPKVTVSYQAIEQEHGPFTSTLIRTVRDDRLDLIGFVVLLKNTSQRPVLFDQTGCAARVGAVYLPQQTSEIPERLEPGAVSPAYFVVDGGGRMHAPLKAKNNWLLSFKYSQPEEAATTPAAPAENAPSDPAQSELAKKESAKS